MAFHPDEAQLLIELEHELRRVEDWPLDSPLGFVIHLAPRTRGKLGELLVARIGAALGIECPPSRSPIFDRLVRRASGDVRVEVKFSTEVSPRFQQVRDPRQLSGTKYDTLVCVSGRPEGLVYWVLDAAVVGSYIDQGLIAVQHQDSRTNWLFPSRIGPDVFAEFRMDYVQFKAWLCG